MTAGAPPQAQLIDPTTLKVLATYQLPTAPTPPGTALFQNFGGGGYFFLDQHDRVWTATKTRHIFVLAIRATRFVKVADYDLTRYLNPDQELTSALPDFRGNIWFVSKRGGIVVGVLDPHTGRVRVTHADSEIENSFAVGRDGVYIVSERSMYRFALGRRRPTGRRLACPLSQLRDPQARPGRRRLGHDADDPARRLRRDHRQCRSDGRRRLPDRRQARSRPATRRLPGAGLSQGRERHREFADRERSLADRREQLRLPRVRRAATPTRSRHRGLPASRSTATGAAATASGRRSARARRRSSPSSRPRPG